MLFPTTPAASSISAPAIIDPHLESSTDSGYAFRRPRYSRPRRRFQMDYLGLTTENMRIVREFLESHRLGAQTFEWLYSPAYDWALVFSTTPVTLRFWHEMRTGQWVFISNPTTALPAGAYRITRVNSTDITLEGTSAGGSGRCSVQIYLPYAVGVFHEGVFEPPSKVIGPYGVDYVGTGDTYATRGRWHLSVSVEEIF